MAAKAKPPVDVLLVDSPRGITGLRKSGKRTVLPGGVVVVSCAAGPEALPEDLTPSAIHVVVDGLDVWSVECRALMLDALMERAGMIDHGHWGERDDTKRRHDEPLIQTCRCGASRTRPRGPHAWSEWA